MPTSGTNRPGPLGGMPIDIQPGVIPAQLELERLGIDAPIDIATFTADLPSEPEAPERLNWYQRSAPLGVPGVVLIGGTSTTSETGPSAFTRLTEVEPGDIVVLNGANDGTFHYSVDSSETLAAPPDFGTLFDPTTEERLVLLGWNDSFTVAANNGGLHQVTGLRISATQDDG